VKKYGIGLLGFGTVGAGVIEGLQKNGGLIASRTGLELELRKVADLDLESDRGVDIDRSILTQDAEAVIESPDVDIVVELIGGTTIARTLTLKALALGKPVVTANKAMLAECAEEIYRTAVANRADIFYEASVGGGIPIIRSLREALIANHIESIYGILNGTCNYILTVMEQDNTPFEKVLADAQAAGYAEADSSLDVDGIDTSHKAVILASLAYGQQISLDDISIRGIRGLDTADIRYALELGYRIKLLAVIKHHEGKIEVGVQPTLVPLDHMLGSVSGVFNAVMVKGDVVDDTLYYGRGAGRLPTASAVLADIADAARNLAFSSPRRVPEFVAYDHYDQLRAEEDIKTRYYLRFSMLDKPGIIAEVARIIGDHGISISSIIQKESGVGQQVPVIMLTHQATEKQFRDALACIDQLAEIDTPTIRYRIEDFKNT